MLDIIGSQAQHSCVLAPLGRLEHREDVISDRDDPSDKREPAAAPQVSHAMEDYLKAAYRLKMDGKPATTQLLADELGVSGPSVTIMV